MVEASASSRHLRLLGDAMCLLASELKISNFSGNVVSFDENVS